MVRRGFRYPLSAGFDLRLVLFSHGWIDLAPLEWDERSLRFTVPLVVGRQAVDMRVTQTEKGISVSVEAHSPLSTEQLRELRPVVPRMLRLDEDLSEFWRLCSKAAPLRWVARRGAGRILRCPSVFEDLLKLLFTTNCSWSATKLMTSRLVEALGPVSPSGRRAFPTPATCAAETQDFYRSVVRAGYRAPHCVQLSGLFAEGVIDEAWFSDPSLSVDEVRSRLLDLPGIGPYAAGQALRTLGFYKDLALDSWCRSKLARRAGKSQPPSDRSIARKYAGFDPYDGLALWMDLTADWHGE